MSPGRLDEDNQFKPSVEKRISKTEKKVTLEMEPKEKKPKKVVRVKTLSMKPGRKNKNDMKHDDNR